MFLKMTCFFFPKKHCFFQNKNNQKKLGKKKHMILMVNKTKQNILFENYECFSNKKMSRAYFC